MIKNLFGPEFCISAFKEFLFVFLEHNLPFILLLVELTCSLKNSSSEEFILENRKFHIRCDFLLGAILNVGVFCFVLK